ncbi:hypothetical protein GQ42DRAFT_55112 [Ramicandelaber brevisporus]|nr:hypothetical protein GQ42DRAFT_55112 [Ramicandelaber brevisporus]
MTTAEPQRQFLQRHREQKQQSPAAAAAAKAAPTLVAGTTRDVRDLYYMRLAVSEALKAAPVKTAYQVGTVLVSEVPTRKLPDVSPVSWLLPQQQERKLLMNGIPVTPQSSASSMDSTTAAAAAAAAAAATDAVDLWDSYVLSTGYSRELEGNTHAEQCALEKLNNYGSDHYHFQIGGGDATAAGWEADDDETGVGLQSEPVRCTLYTTMEPCSLRLSGNRPCCHRIHEWVGRHPVATASPPVATATSSRVASLRPAIITRVVVGIREPPDFVQNCTGVEFLLQSGIQVDTIDDNEIAQLCLDACR